MSGLLPYNLMLSDYKPMRKLQGRAETLLRQPPMGKLSVPAVYSLGNAIA